MAQNFDYTGNPIKIIFPRFLDTYPKVLTITIRDIFKNIPGAQPVELTAEEYGGYYEYQIERVIQSMYSFWTFQVDGCNFTFRDNNISAKVEIYDQMGHKEKYLFSRGVDQLTEIYKKWERPASRFLTKMKTIKYYEGFPPSIVFTKEESGRNVDVLYEGPERDGRRVSIDPNLHTIFFDEAEIFSFDLVDVTDNGYIVLEIEQGEVDRREFKMCKTPEHPFFVVWINNQGGYDYHMFTCNHKISKSLDTNDLAEALSTEEGYFGGLTSYNREGSNVIEVSTGIIDKNMMEVIADMIYSPLVRYIDLKNQSAIEIHPEPTTLEWMEEQPTGEFTLRFRLPNQQINK